MRSTQVTSDGALYGTHWGESGGVEGLIQRDGISGSLWKHKLKSVWQDNEQSV